MNRWFPHKYADHLDPSRGSAEYKSRKTRDSARTSANNERVCICARERTARSAGGKFHSFSISILCEFAIHAATYDFTLPLRRNETRRRRSETKRNETRRGRYRACFFSPQFLARERSFRDVSERKGVTAKNKQAEGNTTGARIGTTDRMLLLQLRMISTWRT